MLNKKIDYLGPVTVPSEFIQECNMYMVMKGCKCKPDTKESWLYFIKNAMERERMMTP